MPQLSESQISRAWAGSAPYGDESNGGKAGGEGEDERPHVPKVGEDGIRSWSGSWE